MKKLEKISSILARDSFDLHRPKASREIDRLILERLFGVKRVFRPCDYRDSEGYEADYHYIPSGKSPRTHMIDARPVPHFSKYIAAAWQVIEKLQQQGIWTSVRADVGGGYRVEMGRPSEQWETYTFAAPVAVCTTTVKYLMLVEEQA